MTRSIITKMAKGMHNAVFTVDLNERDGHIIDTYMIEAQAALAVVADELREVEELLRNIIKDEYVTVLVVNESNRTCNSHPKTTDLAKQALVKLQSIMGRE